MEKEDAGEMILAACKELNVSEPVPLSNYRGFQMELSFDSFQHDFNIVLKGAVGHRISLGTDAREISSDWTMPFQVSLRSWKAREQLTNLQNSRSDKSRTWKTVPCRKQSLLKKCSSGGWGTGRSSEYGGIPCRNVRKQNRQISLLCWQI